MRDVLIPMDQNEANWRQRCNEKLGRLAAQDTININDVQKLYMNSEIFDAVKNGDPDDFVTALDRMLSDQKLPLSVIFNQVTAANDSMLHVAAQFGREKIAELIASHCPSLLSRKNIKGDTALHVAAKCNNSNVIAVILTLYDKQRENCDHGDDEDKNITRSMNNFGSTALHLAVRSHCLDGLTQLFNKDNSVAHYLDKQKRSPLYEAVVSASISSENDRQIIYCLLKDPFLDEPSFPSRHARRSPIHAAIDEKNSDLLKDLIEKSQGLKLFKRQICKNSLSLRCISWLS